MIKPEEAKKIVLAKYPTARCYPQTSFKIGLPNTMSLSFTQHSEEDAWIDAAQTIQEQERKDASR
jgi:hypothetical protein